MISHLEFWYEFFFLLSKKHANITNYANIELSVYRSKISVSILNSGFFISPTSKHRLQHSATPCYTSPVVWTPHLVKHQSLLERVQRIAIIRWISKLKK